MSGQGGVSMMVASGSTPRFLSVILWRSTLHLDYERSPEYGPRRERPLVFRGEKNGIHRSRPVRAV